MHFLLFNLDPYMSHVDKAILTLLLQKLSLDFFVDNKKNVKKF